MQQAELNVITRNTGLKSATRSLRNEGLVPASIYGPGLKNETCAFSEKEMRRVLKNDFNTNFILTLQSESAQLNGKKVILKSVERDPTTWRLTHADLYEVSMDRPLNVSVPINYTGVPEGVKNSGGILQIVRRSVRIRALPTEIPELIEVDISALDLGQSLHLADVKISEKIHVLDSKAFTLVSIVEAEKEEVVEVTPEAAAAAAAAGTGAATPAGTGTAAASGTGAAAAAGATAAAAGATPAAGGAKPGAGKAPAKK